VENIVYAMNAAALDRDPILVRVGCQHPCLCGEPCPRDLKGHRRHRCRPHAWWSPADFREVEEMSPVRPILQPTVWVDSRFVSSST
jgi:hypothetical protein